MSWVDPSGLSRKGLWAGLGPVMRWLLAPCNMSIVGLGRWPVFPMKGPEFPVTGVLGFQVGRSGGDQPHGTLEV